MPPFFQIVYPDYAVKQDCIRPPQPKIPRSSAKRVVVFHRDLQNALNFAAAPTPAVLDSAEGSPAPPAAAYSAKGTTSRVENIPKGTHLAGSENGAAGGLEDMSAESSPMDLDSDCQGDAAGSFSQLQFETGTSPEPPSTSPIQRQIPPLVAPGPRSMDVDSDVQDGLGSQGDNLSLPLTGRSPTNVVTRTKLSAGRHKTSALKTKSIANSSSSSSMESDTDTPEGDSDTQKQSTYRLRAGRPIKPLMAKATASRPTSLRDRSLRFVAKPKSAPSSLVMGTRPSASKAKGMSRHLEKKELLKRKGEVLEEKALHPIDFIDLTTDSWLRRSLTDDMEVLKARHFSV